MKKTFFIIFPIIFLAGCTRTQTVETTAVERSISVVPEQIVSPHTQEIAENVTTENRYVEYSIDSFSATKDKKRVYFFHAPWCPTCKIANEEFEKERNQIPKDVILFRTDYDTEKELKTKYGITYQHTFVYVDGTGKEIKKWNGGGIKELIQHTQ